VLIVNIFKDGKGGKSMDLILNIIQVILGVITVILLCRIIKED
jgi:hypothetical protein